MAFISGIASKVLPVLIVLLIGYLCSRKKFFDQTGHLALKSIIGNITLPVVLFNAFYGADYTSRTLLVFVLVFSSCVIALLIGYSIVKIFKLNNIFLPYLVTGFEAGMLGYGLYSVLVGDDKTHVFAVVDLGQSIFVFTIFLALLRTLSSVKMSAKQAVFDVVKNPPFVGMTLGIIFGITGLSSVVSSSPIGEILSSVVAFISAPTAFLILIVVGFELSFKKRLLKPVLLTILLRFAIMGTLFAVTSYILFSFIPFDFDLMIALAILFSLPPPFVIPIYAKTGEDSDYISTTFSINTLITIAVFALISVFTI